MKNQFQEQRQEKQKNTYSRWSQEEEQFLKYLYENEKIRSWKTITEKMNYKFPNLKRNSKQFRDRYINYLRYDLSNNGLLSWTLQEGSILFQKYAQFGPKWATIAKCLENKSQNCVKNRFYNSLRKYVRKINKILKQNRKIFQKKPIKFEALIKILQFPKILESFNNSLAIQWKHKQQGINQLKQRMLKIIQSCQAGAEKTEQIIQNINDIIQFGKETRFFMIGKQSKKKHELSIPSYLKNQKTQSELINSSFSNNLAKINTQVLGECIYDKEELDKKVFDLQFNNISSNPGVELLLIDECTFGDDKSSNRLWESEISQFLNNTYF